MKDKLQALQDEYYYLLYVRNEDLNGWQKLYFQILFTLMEQNADILKRMKENDDEG